MARLSIDLHIMGWLMPYAKVMNEAHIKLWEEFDEAIGNKFGADCTPGDFPDVALDNTPHYNKYDNVNIDLRHKDN